METFLHLLGKGDNVRRVVKAPLLVGPESAAGQHAALHLVHDERDVVLARQCQRLGALQCDKAGQMAMTLESRRGGERRAE